MKCPRCSKEMEEGYLFLKTGRAAKLHWSKYKPTFWTMPEELIEVLKWSSLFWRDKENWLRKSYRCEKCGLYVFEEKYTLPSEGEEKQKKPEGTS